MDLQVFPISTEIDLKYDIYGCPKCGSFIEIIYEDEKHIEFKCVYCKEKNKGENKIMTIQEYINGINSIYKCFSCRNEIDEKKNLNFVPNVIHLCVKIVLMFILIKVLIVMIMNF